jgi:hypothetical protein
MKKVLYFATLAVLIVASAVIYWSNLNECMTEFSTFYCLTQVK